MLLKSPKRMNSNKTANRRSPLNSISNVHSALGVLNKEMQKYLKHRIKLDSRMDITMNHIPKTFHNLEKMGQLLKYARMMSPVPKVDDSYEMRHFKLSIQKKPISKMHNTIDKPNSVSMNC